MGQRRLRCGGRKKAPFGSQEAAILAAAGINVAGTLAASAISASATKKAAQDQANATINAAQKQAQAVKDQTARSKEYQQEAQEFVKEQNAENRELQKDIQMQLQMLTGQQNVNDRLEASKIKVKAGGSTRRRLRDAGVQQSLLRGGNMPFVVTDGGGVLPLGLTPEGFELYEIRGNDHEHYHKTRGGKYKSGVGIKFADGNVVEGEGNQKKNGGELMLVTPDNAYFISKHNINGFNPADSVKYGVHPLQAYAIQEQEKAIAGINDDGTRKAKCGTKKRFLIGGTPNLYDYAGQLSPTIGTDTVGDTAVGVAYATQNPDEKRSLKCGGKCRKRAYWGTDAQGRRIWISGTSGSTSQSSGPGNGGRTSYYGNTPGGSASSSTTPRGSNGGPGTGGRTGVNTYGGGGGNTGGSSKGSSGSGTRSAGSGGFWSDFSWNNGGADLAGAGLNALGNVGGAWITASANRAASQTLADAYNKGANIMADAYRSLKTIDMNSIRKEDYAAAHMMPALQAPVSFAASQIAGVDRKLQRRLANAGRYSASGAAAQQRMADADVEAQDEKNRIYSADQQQMQQIRQANAERVTEAARMNAYLDTQANQQYSGDYLKLLQYNNDIENEKILGAAGATSEGAINGAGAIAQGQTSAAQAWSTALANSGLTFSNTLSSMAKRKADLENTMLGATTDAKIDYISRNGNTQQVQDELAAVNAALKNGNLSDEDKAKYEYYKTKLERRLNRNR